MVYTKLRRSGKPFTRVAVAVCLAAGFALRAASGFASEVTGVRSTNPVVSGLITEGASRSPSFQLVLERVSETGGIVYAEFGHGAFGHLNGCFVVPTTEAHRGRC
jgi:hypothetical protein